MKTSTKVMIIVAILFASIIAMPASVSGTDQESWVLFDHGNGATEWVEASMGDVGSVTKKAAESASVTFSSSEGVITIDGVTTKTIGSYGSGSLIVSGATGVKVTSSWYYYEWIDGKWVISSYDELKQFSTSIAFGFYPSDAVPTETPDNRSSWVMVRGDSANSGAESSVYSTESAKTEWTHPSRTGGDYVCSSILVEGNNVYVGFGGGYSSDKTTPAYYCYDRITGEEIWHFDYEIGAGYETASATIYNGSIFIPATNGNLYKIPLTGPGDDNENVKSIKVPYLTGATLTGSKYNTGASTLIFDSGVIYCGSSNGMVYCFNTDLELIWSYQTGGSIYYSSPTVFGDYIAMGSLNGGLCIIDRLSGSLVDSDIVYTATRGSSVTGLVSPVVAIGDILMFPYSDGRGMNTTTGGLGIYSFDGEELIKVMLIDSIGIVGTYITPVVNDDFSGVYLAASKGIFKVDVSGNKTLLDDTIEAVKAPMTLLNGDYLFFAEYKAGGAVYKMDLDGKIVSKYYPPSDVSSYTMGPIIIIDEWMYIGNDGGMYAVSGNISSGGSSSGDAGNIVIYVLILLAILVVAAYVYLRFVKGIRPFASVSKKISEYFGLNNSNLSHTKRNKRRLTTVIVVGMIVGLFVFLLCLAYGPSGNLSLGETFSALISSLQKGGQNLDFNELIVFESRLPRALVAFAVGIGLSVAGTIYQAIIRNPMVDPYIMGVSGGAGTAAVAVIAFNFTFFGMFDAGSVYLTAIAAIIGGLIAFGATMLIAEKSGGMSINYVLGGIVIGLAFSAVQSLMLSMAGHKVSNALAWLFGSFSSVSWSNAWLVIIPAIVLSLVPLLWAKELNLVLVGEDQAKQMGLDVRKFNRWMLILASVITAICVAFVGIIGFVGLVIPHLCRMILGGDHRLVLPASMVLGGALMMLADFAAKMLMIPTELPVGAITTIIGVPVFAYLLIKKGRMYDG